eukprot:5451921-Prymnesium_polylepis.1
MGAGERGEAAQCVAIETTAGSTAFVRCPAAAERRPRALRGRGVGRLSAAHHTSVFQADRCDAPVHRRRNRDGLT